MTYHQPPDLQRISWIERFAQRHKRGVRTLMEYAVILAAVGLAFLFFTAQEADSAPQSVVAPVKASAPAQPSKTPPSAISDLPDPCGLKEVVCEGEKQVIKGTVTAYQAVSGQTDSSPCVTADGSNACDPKARIVANNCLPFGTTVEIRGKRYEVHDRMNKRYGCDVFDVLTQGEVFKLINEPITVR